MLILNSGTSLGTQPSFSQGSCTLLGSNTGKLSSKVPEITLGMLGTSLISDS